MAIISPAARLLMACAIGSLVACQTPQGTTDTLQVGNAELGGVVASANGPEPGVWVIAETTDLPTKFAKVVVTDDQGRYVIPELPKASYSVWVRGYGLVDSPKVQSSPGRRLDLRAVVAPNAAAAAEYYPPIYWYALLRIPAKSQFPGTGAKGNGIADAMMTQGEWLNSVKSNGCMTCHALGTKATRTMPKDFMHFKSSTEAGRAALPLARP